MSRLRATNKITLEKKPYQAVFERGQSRREFLTNAGVAIALASLLASKPVIAKDSTRQIHIKPSVFSTKQQAIIEAVQQQLFPDDGDGPSAKDIQAFRYLLWALEDTKNKEDGDPAFILRGITWLETQADEQFAQPFIQLETQEQHEVLSELVKTARGESWMSLLVYYLLEALLLDPVYGGNPQQVGWQWLEHQPGYPRPTKARTYRYYQALS